MKSLLRTFALAAGAFVVFVSSASAQQRTVRMDARLRALLQPEVQSVLTKYPKLHRDAIRLRERLNELPLGGAYVLDTDDAGETRVGIIAEGDAGAADRLRAAGGIIGTAIPTADGTYVVTARVPVRALEALEKASQLTRIEADRTITVENDSSMRAIGADRVRQVVNGSWAGAAGQNILVGIYDTGLDFRHDDFRKPDGTTRVVSLWDQTTGGRPPAGFTYGFVCTPTDINLAINGASQSCPQRDTFGHGTHVAGIAAGDGSAVGTSGVGTAFQYAGVAPLADLLIVKGGNGTFSQSSILDGLAYMSATARALRQPAVVNLSLGSQDGPHDGSSVFERGIDNVARDSFVIVFSSGNEGSNGNTSPAIDAHYIHASGTAAVGDSTEFSFSVPNYTPNTGTCNDFTVVDIWFDVNDRYDVRVIRPNGSSIAAGLNQTQISDDPTGQIVIDQAARRGDVTTPDNQTEIVVSDCSSNSGPPASGEWRIRVIGRTLTSGKPFHMWITRTQYGAGGGSTGLQGFDNRFIVSSPGTAKNVITVGAFASRVCWPSQAGQICYTQRETIGDIARFSGGGPTRDGRMKPEIVAPGIGIMSAFSSDAVGSPSRGAPDGVHIINQGTSMAAPHVTGAIALMLQQKPDLNVAEVREVLSRSAVQDAFTTRTYSGGLGRPQDWWGFGKLNVPNALALLATTPSDAPVAAISLTPRVDTVVVNAASQVRATPVDSAGVPLIRTVTYTSTNPQVATVDDFGVVTARAPGLAFIVVRSEAARDSSTIVVVGPSLLTISGASPTTPASAPTSTKGARIAVLRVGLAANGAEAIDVGTLGFDVRGEDPAARVQVIRDANRNGRIDTQDAVLGSTTAALNGGTAQRISIATPSLRVGARDSVVLLLAVEMSGAAPNGATFEAALVPAAVRTTGVLSRVSNSITQPTVAITAPGVRTTLLASSEFFALSENPVKSGRVVFNFSVRPTVAGVYTLGGRLVTDLIPRLSSDGRVEWDLVNDSGGDVAPGVYLIVFNVSGQLVREKLFVMRPQS